MFLLLREPGGHQDVQRWTGGKPQSSDQPLQTDPSLADRSRHLSLASNNPIKVHGPCRRTHAAHSQLPEHICGQQGAGTRSGAGTPSGQHPPAKSHKEPLHPTGWDSSKPPALPHKHSLVSPPSPKQPHAAPMPFQPPHALIPHKPSCIKFLFCVFLNPDQPRALGISL